MPNLNLLTFDMDQSSEVFTYTFFIKRQPFVKDSVVVELGVIFEMLEAALAVHG